jgi:hypothetical protein
LADNTLETSLDDAVSNTAEDGGTWGNRTRRAVLPHQPKPLAQLAAD